LQSQQILQILQQLVLQGPYAASAQDPQVMQLLLALQEQERQLLAQPTASGLAVLDVVSKSCASCHSAIAAALLPFAAAQAEDAFARSSKWSCEADENSWPVVALPSAMA